MKNLLRFVEIRRNLIVDVMVKLGCHKMSMIALKTAFSKPGLVTVFATGLVTGLMVDATIAQSRPTLTVGTNSAPPLMFLDSRDRPQAGYSLELWEIIADELKVDYQWRSFKTVPGLLQAVETGEVDLAIAAITATSEREATLDFSHPYYQSGLHILVRNHDRHPLLIFWYYLLSPQTLQAIGVVLGLALLSAHCLWWFERNHNPAMFPRQYWRGIWEALWWSLVTATTVGYGDKAPVGVVGRLVAVIWMFGGLFVVAYFTAALTNNHLDTTIRNLMDLRGRSVGVVAETTAAEFAASHAVEIIPFETAAGSYLALKRERVDAIIGDAPVLLYKASQEGWVKVAGTLLDPQPYAIALPPNSPLREPINRTLLELIESGRLQELEHNWFSSQP
jgi:polar amino acid transport system substrate-binding protein